MVGLMISSLAVASRVFRNKTYLEMASAAARFINQNLYDKETKRLFRSYCEGRSDILGFSDDYAFLIQGLNLFIFLSSY